MLSLYRSAWRAGEQSAAREEVARQVGSPKLFAL